MWSWKKCPSLIATQMLAAEKNCCNIIGWLFVYLAINTRRNITVSTLMYCANKYIYIHNKICLISKLLHIIFCFIYLSKATKSTSYSQEKSQIKVAKEMQLNILTIFLKLHSLWKSLTRNSKKLIHKIAFDLTKKKKKKIGKR